LSAGKDPTIPALHWAITNSGPDMINNGALITGKDNLFWRIFGIDNLAP
jgi:hypothetical protein